MAKIDAHEITDISGILDKLGTKWEGIAKASLWDGADVIKKALEDEINALPTTAKDTYYHSKTVLPLRRLRPVEKQGLLDGLRVFKFESDSNGVSVAVGFVGDNKISKPNILIARSLVRGTSVQKKNDFVKRAYNKNRERCEKVIANKIYSITGKFNSYYTNNK